MTEPVQPTYPQPAVEPGGDLPNVGTPETPVEALPAGAGQPTEQVSDEETYVVSQDPLDDTFSGLVSVKYNGEEVYTEDGFYMSPGETKIVSASDARALVNGGNGNFEVV